MWTCWTSGNPRHESLCLLYLLWDFHDKTVDSNTAEEIRTWWVHILFFRKGKNPTTPSTWKVWKPEIPLYLGFSKVKAANIIVTDRAWLRRKIFGREKDLVSHFHCSKQWCQYFKSQCPSKEKKNPLQNKSIDPGVCKGRSKQCSYQ